MPPGLVLRGQGGAGLPSLAMRLWERWTTRENSNNNNKSHSNDGKSKSSSNNSSNGKNENGSSQSSESAHTVSSPHTTSSPTPTNTGNASPTTSSFPFGCFPGQCIPDNDPRVLYSPTWSIESLPFFQTAHQTHVVGSSLSLTFDGSGITVFGSIPSSNITHPPPTTVYMIDAAQPFTTAEPMAALPVPNQPLFSASHLSAGKHTLVVNVTAVQFASPFSIDYFIIAPSSPASSTGSALGSSVSSTALEAAHTTSNAAVGVLAGVLSAVTFILLCGVAFLIVALRRRRKRQQQSKSLESSLFTRAESILRWSRVPSLRSTNSHYPFHRSEAHLTNSSEKSIRVG
ncbi:hypothetical protein C8F01DRAFT_1367177 [Mycena amicta]|nr:hypothetical protein C8F01DRAFT_1367177 [Mycena amicta]